MAKRRYCRGTRQLTQQSLAVAAGSSPALSSIIQSIAVFYYIYNVLNFDKHYNSAKKLVGASGRDLVHHCYLLVHDKLEGFTYPDTYFHRTMLNQLSNKDSWRRQEATVHPKALMHEVSRAENIQESEYVDLWQGLNAYRINELIEHLHGEGPSEAAAVDVFRSKANGQTVKSISESTGVCRATLAECIEFVKSTVKERYTHD